jgi:hypothetical protein
LEPLLYKKALPLEILHSVEEEEEVVVGGEAHFFQPLLDH